MITTSQDWWRCRDQRHMVDALHSLALRTFYPAPPPQEKERLRLLACAYYYGESRWNAIAGTPVETGKVFTPPPASQWQYTRYVLRLLEDDLRLPQTVKDMPGLKALVADVRYPSPLSYSLALRRSSPEIFPALVREIYPDPWEMPSPRPPVTPTVETLARAAEYNRVPSARKDMALNGVLDSSRLLVLADALEEEGYQDERLLRHLRGWEEAVPGWYWCRNCHRVWYPTHGRDNCCEGAEQPANDWMPLRCEHVRGCWAVRTILKEFDYGR